MKMIPVGIADPERNRRSFMKAEDFSGGHFEGVELRCDRKHNPVVIMHSKRNDPLRWRVVYGFSEVYFRTFAEAVEFCNTRGFRLMKEQVQ